MDNYLKLTSGFRYRSLLDAILTSSRDDLTETLKVFIEASMTCVQMQILDLKLCMCDTPALNPYHSITHTNTAILFSCKWEREFGNITTNFDRCEHTTDGALRSCI